MPCDTGGIGSFAAGTQALLRSAEEGEDAARQAYENALDKFLPAPVREVLIRHAAHIETSLAYVKAARKG